MVDCGEGTQHQMKLSTLKIGKLKNIFITHLHGDHCYGLFGLLHSIRNDDNKEFTLNIYGPPGLKQMIFTTLNLSGGLHHYKLNIIEIRLKNANANSNKKRQKMQRKSSYDMDVSCNETDEDSSMNDHQHNEMDNDLDYASKEKSMTFTTEDVVSLGEIEPGIRVYACRITHRIETFGYVFIENDKLGRLDAAKAKSLGAKGKQMGDLKNGKDVTLDDGTIIYSKDVVGEQEKGNKIGIMQDCSDCRSCYDIAQDCDLLIHECTYNEDQAHLAVDRGHSTAKMAAAAAVKCQAKMLMLTHFSSRFVEESGMTQAINAEKEKKKNNDNNDNTDNGDNDVEIKDNEEDEEEDLMHVQRLQKEAESVIEQYKSKCVVRCAADFMSIRFGKNKTISIDKELAITESKKEHFKHDLPYLKTICGDE